MADQLTLGILRDAVAGKATPFRRTGGPARPVARLDTLRRTSELRLRTYHRGT